MKAHQSRTWVRRSVLRVSTEAPVRAPARRAPNRMPATRPPVAMSAEIEDFYRHLYFPLVKRVQWRFHLPKEDARDVVQDAFAIALTKLDASMNPKAWLIQVVDYLSANACRKARRRAFLYARWAGSPEGLGVVSEG